MKILAAFVVLAASTFAALDKDATQRIFGPFADADRLAIWDVSSDERKTRQPHVLAEVKGASHVSEVLSYLTIEKKELSKQIDEETGDEVYVHVIHLFARTDYTLAFFRDERELGRVDLIGLYFVIARGEKEDQRLPESTRSFLAKRFNLAEDPQDEMKTGNQPPVHNALDQQ